MDKKEEIKKPALGRPKKQNKDEMLNEEGEERLAMSESEKEEDITLDDVSKRWRTMFDKIAKLDAQGQSNISTVTTKWNKLNPFLQNQRIKNLYSKAKTYNKANISKFLETPGNYEQELRSLGWTNSSSQQIYYNILRRSCDIPLYNYFIIPEYMEDKKDYDKEKFKQEDSLVQNWLEVFDVKNTFKTIALEVKREGKSSYLLRNRIVGQGKSRETSFCTLQKLPTDWVKITGKGQLGYTISFNMMYFFNAANSPTDFGPFITQAWNDMCEKGVITQDEVTKAKALNIAQAQNYKFTYKDNSYSTSIEGFKQGKKASYMLWLQMPDDICYTFSSDNSHPWVAPDTMGLMLKMQELNDYGQLAGLIASTPLTAVLTGEIETIPSPRAGKNESVYSPEVLQGYMEQFNAATSTNVEAWLWPAKNIKLQQLSADVNSSDIISTATSNFLESAGEGGLTIATDKPNVAQIKVAKQLAAAQQHYVTLQFERVLNFILQHKLGLTYQWKIRIWGDIFSQDDEKKYLKEIVANGNVALLPKLMSAEGISMRDTASITNYIKQFGFYEDFMTYTQLKSAEISEKNKPDIDDSTKKLVGRPPLDEDEIDNENTAASRDDGTNTSDNRE